MIYLYVTYMSNLLTASEFAKVCQVTPRTIRWYQKIGVLKPKKIDKWNRYAYFAPEQALDIFRIRMLQQLEIPLKDVRKSFKNQSLGQKINKLEKLINEKQEEIGFLKEIDRTLYQQDPQILLNENSFGPATLLCMKIADGEYAKINEYLHKLREIAKDYGIKIIGEGMTFYENQSLTYQPKNTPLRIAFMTKSHSQENLPENVYIENFSKISVLSHNFEAPTNQLHYIYLPLLYQKLDSYIKRGKISIKGPVFEVYANTSTAIYYPI